MRKSAVLVILGAILYLPVASNAQYLERENSRRENVSRNYSIVILSEEKGTLPGYVHQKYVFLANDCKPMEVDHYGPPIDPNDRNFLLREHQICRQRTFANV
jgi:hypothetical protein